MRSVAAIAAIAIAGSAWGADLDAPVVPKAPTIGSEIHRGADAASGCKAVDPVRLPQAYLRCIEAAQEGNRQAMGSSFQAFDAGLHFKARRQFEILAHLMPQDPMMRSDFEIEDARYQQARDALGVTDDQVLTASYSG